MRNIYSINKDWVFLKGVAFAPEAMPSDGERVDLPHTWNGIDGQDGGNDYFRGKCCYVKTLRRSELPKGERYFIEINGANSSAEVYVNGKSVVHHDGGYSTFRADITSVLKDDDLLAVIVDNGENDRVYPQTADFTFYGWLYRDVNIISVSSVHFALEPYGTSGIYVIPTLQGSAASVKTVTASEGVKKGDKIRFTITDANGKTVCKKEGENAECELVIEKAHLWDGTKDPYLYTAKAEIVRNGEVLDSVSTRFGCRCFEIDPQRGFILNGREYPLRGVSRHQDRKGIGNALLPEHHKEDMELIREMGANTIRLAHYQHDQYFYDLCDEYGMVVWAEIPYISRHMPNGNANTEIQMTELITQCRDHPSIVVWGLSNEITMDGARDADMVAQHKKLNALAHRLDPTRRTAIACLSVCGIDEEYVHIPDAVSYNHYFGWYGGDFNEYAEWFDSFHKKYPKTPIGISEYGCEALDWHNSSPEAGDYSEEYQAMYHEALIKQLFQRKYIWAAHVWNMFDFGADARAEGGENGQNHKGLITFDRSYKKDAFYAYKAWLSDEPFVHICGKRYIDRVEEVTKVTVYSNLPEVELFANGNSLGKKQEAEHFFYFDVPSSGDTELVAVAGDCRDESRIRKVEKFNESYILREQAAVLNWFDITEPEGRFSLNSKIRDIKKTPRGKLWVLKFFMKLAKKQKSGGKNGGAGIDPKSMMKMISSFSVLRLTGMLGMINVDFTKDELLKMNRQLNKIKKPQSKKTL